MHDSGDDQPAGDPWAPGGAMSGAWEPRSALTFEAVDDHDPPDRARRWGGRRRRVGGGVLAVVALTAIGAIVVDAMRGDDPADDARVPASSLPFVVDSSPADVTEPGTDLPDAATGAPETDAAPDEQGDDGGAAAGVPGEIGAVVIASRPPSSTVVDLAPELAGIDPTEVIALSHTGEIVEVSIPSGRVRTTAVGFPTDRAQLAATDFGALVWSMPGGAFELLSIDGARGFVAGEPPTLVRTTPRLDRFYVWTERPDQPTAARLDIVSANGDHRADQPDVGGIEAYRSLLVDPSGALLAGDTGGTYRVDESGTQRLSVGDVVATGRNHILLRECDEQRVCSLATLDTNGFRTRFPTDLPDDASPLIVGGLSPAGDALLLVGDRTGSVANPPRLEVLELVDGARRVVYSAADFPATGAWANDSSGVFFADVVLRFVDRVTGADVVVSGDLPKLRAITTRQPAASPPCEVLALALPIFDEMRAATDEPVAPPPVEVLAAVVRVAPADVAAAAQPMVDFVDSFVSLEQPESRRVENWPSEVRAGLTALELFAASECVATQT